MQSQQHFVKVFVAEDSAPIRERVCSALAAHHMQVVGEAATPADCIQGILDSHPDVVVLDIHLEGGSGLQVLKAVRRQDAHVGFVVFSNAVEGPYRKHYLAAGASSVLDKAADFDALPAAVAEATRH